MPVWMKALRESFKRPPQIVLARMCSYLHDIDDRRARTQALQTDEIAFDFREALFTRPDVEGRCRDLVDDRDREPGHREVDGFEVVLAGGAGFDADVRERGAGRVEVPELMLIFFTAVRTEDAPERPHRQAGGAEQMATTAVGLH